MAKLNQRDHAKAFDDSVKKCDKTRILDATSWSHWGGYRDTGEKLQEINELADQYESLYVLSAPTLVAVAAIRLFRNIQTNGKDDASIRTTNLRQLNFIPFAIQHYNPDYKFTSTDREYHMDPNVPRPKLAKAQREREEARRAEMETLKKQLQARARAEIEARDDADANERSTQVDAQLKQSEASKPLSAKPTRAKQIEVQTERTINREEALKAVGDLVIQTLQTKDNPLLNEQLEKSLNEPILIVLPTMEKAVLQVWAEHNRKTEVSEWIMKATEDKFKHTWTEVTFQEELEVVDVLMNDFKSKVNKLMEANTQPELQPFIKQVNEAGQTLFEHICLLDLPWTKTDEEAERILLPMQIGMRNQAAAIRQLDKSVNKQMECMNTEIRDLKRAFQQAFPHNTAPPTKRTKDNQIADTGRLNSIKQEGPDEEDELD